MYVLVVMSTLFLMISLSLSLTRASRRISGHYIRFAGNYDLALGAKEMAFFHVRREAGDNTTEIVEQVYQRLHYVNPERYLHYHEGDFLLGTHFMRLFREEKRLLLSGYLSTYFERIHAGHYFFYYTLTVPTGTYYVRTYLEANSQGYRTRSTSRKNSGTAVNVFGQIEWPAFSHLVVLIPKAYYWRDAEEIPIWSYLDFYGSLLPDEDVENILNNPSYLFSIPMYEEDRRVLFDLLGLTRFGEAAYLSNFADILGEVIITEFELEMDPIVGFTPRLIRVQHVAN